MRTFLIPIGIGFLLIALFFIRVIGISSEVPPSATPASQRAPNSAKSTLQKSAGRTVQGLSGHGKTVNNFKPLEPLAITPVEHKFTTFYDSGILSSEWNFKNARLNGAYKTYYDNKATWSVSNFQNGQFEGAGKVFYPSGALFQESSYVKGRLEGHVKQYYIKGGQWFDMTFVAGVLAKTPQIYSENGDLARAAIVHDEKLNEERIHTILTSYYLDQKTSSIWNFKSSVIDGQAVIYYASGSPMCEMNFKNGQFSGETKCFYESGELLSQTVYFDGVPEGMQYQYYKTGAKWIETEFKDGKIKTFPKAYSENGKTSEEKNRTKG